MTPIEMVIEKLNADIQHYRQMAIANPVTAIMYKSIAVGMEKAVKIIKEEFSNPKLNTSDLDVDIVKALDKKFFDLL
jgi:hypothetical protein